jgi:hypothetical protein
VSRQNGQAQLFGNGVAREEGGGRHHEQLGVAAGLQAALHQLGKQSLAQAGILAHEGERIGSRVQHTSSRGGFVQGS